MTSSGRREPTTLSDPRLDAAWRALSRDAPPESLDAAILAAARREVGAKPGRIGALTARAADRRWWPLAAAATIAAIAVGVLQLTTPDQLGAPAADSGVVSDTPAPAAAPAPAAPPPLPGAATKAESRGELSAEGAVARADAPHQPATPAAPPTPKKQASTTAPEPDTQTLAAAPGPERQMSAVTPGPERQISAATPGPERQRSTTASRAAVPDPFPAAPPPPAASGPAPRVAAQDAPPSPATMATPERASEGVAARPAPLAKSAAGHAAEVSADDARGKHRAALSVADWIALIRRLRDEGRSTEVARELAAFRAAHADHAKLLPPDLRDWRPPDPREVRPPPN